MLNRFYNYLKNLKGYSERTCSEYLKDLKGFSHWVKANKPNARWSTLTRSDLDEHIVRKMASRLRQLIESYQALALCIDGFSVKGCYLITLASMRVGAR